MIIGFGVGGGYDLWARTVAQHMGAHLPGNPTLISQNMPAGGSLAAANFLYEVAPKDGTVIGLIGRDAPLAPITGASGARFDPTKMSWLGTPTKETNICIAYHTAAVKTVQDLYDKELVMGDVGPGSGTRAYPKALAALLGMKFKLVSGYPSSADIFLAMERGEVQGICESLDSVESRRPDWISSSRSRSCSRARRKPIRRSKECRWRAISRATTRSGKPSTSSTPGRASDGRSWRPRTCRRMC